MERTCGELSTLRELMGFDGATELNADIVTNTEIERSGLALNVYCVDPNFDLNALPLWGDKRKKRNVGDGINCTSPNGRGPRDEPQLPPPVCCNDHVKLHFDPPISCIHSMVLHAGCTNSRGASSKPLYILWCARCYGKSVLL